MVESLVTQSEAHEIARSVERYWALRGYAVRTEVVRCEETIAGRGVFTVHSDLINGFPRDFPMTWAAIAALRAFGTEPREKAA